jgi:hypothetical protein
VYIFKTSLFFEPPSGPRRFQRTGTAPSTPDSDLASQGRGHVQAGAVISNVGKK